jgi:hypothetical protein
MTWLLAVGLFALFGRRWLAAQTTTATWLNILLVWLVIGVVRWLLSGWSVISYADQHFLREYFPWWILWRALAAGLMAAIWQRFRRQSFTRLATIG